MARYIIHATGASGQVTFTERLTIGEALDKARDLKEAHFSHITLVNVLTGIEITDLDALMDNQESNNAQGS